VLRADVKVASSIDGGDGLIGRDAAHRSGSGYGRADVRDMLSDDSLPLFYDKLQCGVYPVKARVYRL
jgi:hypothetical protein